MANRNRSAEALTAESLTSESIAELTESSVSLEFSDTDTDTDSDTDSDTNTDTDSDTNTDVVENAEIVSALSGVDLNSLSKNELHALDEKLRALDTQLGKEENAARKAVLRHTAVYEQKSKAHEQNILDRSELIRHLKALRDKA